MSHCGSGSSEVRILKGKITQKLKHFCFRFSGEKTEFGAWCQQLLPVVDIMEEISGKVCSCFAEEGASQQSSV